MFVSTLGSVSEETVLDLIEHRALETTKLTFFADVILHFFDHRTEPIVC